MLRLCRRVEHLHVSLTTPKYSLEKSRHANTCVASQRYFNSRCSLLKDDSTFRAHLTAIDPEAAALFEPGNRRSHSARIHKVRPNQRRRRQHQRVLLLGRTIGERSGSRAANGNPNTNTVRRQSAPVKWMTIQERLQSTTVGKTLEMSLQGGGPQPSGQDDANMIAKPSEIKSQITGVDSEVSPKTKSKSTTKSKTTTAKTKRKTKTEETPLNVQTISPQELELSPIEDNDDMAVPKLSYNLDRILFNPGVYHLQDPRSRVFNFDPYLATIMPAEEFDYDALKAYTTSSKDTKLRDLTVKLAWRMPKFDYVSRSLEPEFSNFTQLNRGPAAAFADFTDGVYAIDSDKEYDTDNILSSLGRSMEKLLTLPTEEFEKYHRTKSHELTEEERNADEAYHYTTMGDFLMRSQLDARDRRLPGTGVFDLKTRAVISIRMDVKGYEKGVDYEIRKRFGQWESFEREYYDLIRAAFLKYSLQVRMGRMDGVFVAFHNTQRIFGFQYISLPEMDFAIHGTTDTQLGDQEFKASLKLLNELLNKATERFPGRTLRLHAETRPTKVPLTYFFVEPVSPEEMKRIQEASKPFVDQAAENIRSLGEKEQLAENADDEKSSAETTSTESENVEEESELEGNQTSQDIQSDTAWRDMIMKVDETVESEALGIRSVREAVQDALEQSGLLQGKTEAESEKYLDGLATALAKYSLESRDLRESTRSENDTPGENEGGNESSPFVEATESNDKSLKDLILKVTETINDKEANLADLERLFTGQSAADAPASETTILNNGTKEDSLNTDQDVGPRIISTGGSSDTAVTSGPKQRELLGMYVTIRNKVNGKFVERPEIRSKDQFNWDIEYNITELADEKARTIYESIKKRREKILRENPDRSREWYRMYQGQLPTQTAKGRRFREERRRLEEGQDMYVAWDQEPIQQRSAV